MTQDVQPLTWQKRTNIEEHMQFFSKINEIIANLAPTVDEAEAAIAQATAAIASANDAIATANAASAAASAAATQAQTAASTVAGYDTRLTAAEGDIDALQAADQTMGFNIMSLGNRVTATESKNTQQDTAIGALQTADAQNVKISGTHAIGNYALLLTDNQTAYGDKRFMGRILERVSYVKNTLGATMPIPIFRMSDITRDNRYMKTSLFISGRTTPTTITEVVWNDAALTKTDILGTQTNPFTIMSDTEGHYWLCMSIVANNTLNVFALDCIRNAGYDEPIYPLITGETPDMTGWTTVVSQ